MTTRFNFILPLLLGLIANAALAESLPFPIKINIANGKLSVDARDVALPALLQSIADKAAFRLTIQGKVDTRPRQWAMHELPLEEGLKQLVQPYSMALLYKPASESSELTISTLLIIGTVEGSAPPTTSSPAPHAETPVTNGLQQLVQMIKEGANPGAQLQTIRYIESLGTPEAARALESLLGVADSTIRSQVVSSLGKFTTDATILALGQAVLTDKAVNIRLAAVNALSNINDDRCLPFLMQAAKDADKLVQKAALQALEKRNSANQNEP